MPAWQQPLPAGVLAVKRGSYVFVQNCTEQPVTVGESELPRYGTAVWNGVQRVL